MKQFWMIYGLLSLLCCLASCTEEEATESPRTGVSLSVSVAPMELKGEPQTRALFPLGPEDENMIKTLALLVFDQEGQHYIGNYDFYGFRSYTTADNPNGTLTAYEPQYSAGLERGTICAVANMPEEELLTALRNKASEGGGSSIISLSQFKELTVELPYIQKADSVGLVSNIYMFGYYEGDLRPYEASGNEPNISISLGRIITRLDVSLSVNSTIDRQNFLFAMRLLQTSRKAYLFPGERSPEETHDDDYFHPVQLSQNPYTLYYYVGPHSATGEDDATCVEIAYGKTANANGTLDVNANPERRVRIALCNEPPGTVNRNYWLNRNSIYSLSIRLVRKGEETTRSDDNGLTRVSYAPDGTYVVEIDTDDSDNR